jgi:hypothetical protein
MATPTPEDVEEIIRRLDAIAAKRRERVVADTDMCWTCYLVGEHACAVHGDGTVTDHYRAV